jgi:hypothetical protein
MGGSQRRGRLLQSVQHEEYCGAYGEACLQHYGDRAVRVHVIGDSTLVTRL